MARRTFNLDATPAGQDWIKQGAWDIPATNPAELRGYLAQRGISRTEFKRRPVYKAHVKDMPWLKDL